MLAPAPRGPERTSRARSLTQGRLVLMSVIPELHARWSLVCRSGKIDLLLERRYRLGDHDKLPCRIGSGGSALGSVLPHAEYSRRRKPGDPDEIQEIFLGEMQHLPCERERA